MNKTQEEGLITEEQWQAILHSDAAYDDEFFYAVKTTGSFADPPVSPSLQNERMPVSFRTLKKRKQPDFVPVKDASPRGSVYRIRNGSRS